LAFTGCRLGEAREIRWRDLEFESGMVVVRGDPIGATKNSEVRRVPMIADARALFERIRATRPNEPKDAKAFLVRECQKAMDRAARLVVMVRTTHHDLRHLFATICIESGVDEIGIYWFGTVNHSPPQEEQRPVS
jgi:integrase